MIYSPFYRPRYPFSYSKPINNIYTYSVKKEKSAFEDNKKDCIPHIGNHKCENKKANINNDNQILEIFRNFSLF